MIRGLGLIETAELLALAPVEEAAVDHRTTDGSAVAGQELGGGMHHQVGAPFDRSAQVGRGQGVVDDQRDTGISGELSQRLEIGDDASRVGQALAEDRLGALADRRPHGLRLLEVDEVDVPVELLEALAELRDRAAIQAVRSHETIAGLHEGEEGQDLRAVPGGAAGAAAAAFEAGEPLLERGNRRVGEA